MLIDCHGCVMRDIACSDCVVTMLLGPMPSSLDAHKDALDVLADAGLVAPLRLVTDENKSIDRSGTVSTSSSDNNHQAQRLASNL